MGESAIYTAVDIETTGLRVYEADVIEIAAVRFEAGQPTGESFVGLARPRVPIPADATAVHGMTDDDLRDAPEIGETMAGLAKFLRGELVVCHNAGFDVPFLARELRAHGLETRSEVTDTIAVAKRRVSLWSYSLGPLCDHLGIPIADRHRAEGDALATGEALWKLMRMGSEGAVATLAGLPRSRPLEPVRFDDLADLPAASMIDECPPGTEVELTYSTGRGAPRPRRVTVEFYSRTRDRAYLTARSHSHQGQRRAYRLDRVVGWG